MERELAKAVAAKATMKEVIKTLLDARTKTTDWAVRSEINRGCTKGTSFNILVKALLYLKKNHPIPPSETFYTFKGDWQFKDLIEK